MNDLASNPIDGVVYGDRETCAIEINIFPDGERPYQLCIWEEGGSAALEYHESWEDCLDWIQKLPVSGQHETSPEHEPTIAALASQLTENGYEQWFFLESKQAERYQAECAPAESHSKSIFFVSELVEPEWVAIPKP